MATPPLSVPDPIALAPSVKVTLPVGVPEPVGVTVAVRVIGWPYVDGLGDEATVVVVAVEMMVCVNAGEVLRP